MNPMFISEVVRTLHSLKRTRPQCKKGQVVAPRKRRKRVRCRFCAADIPPGK